MRLKDDKVTGVDYFPYRIDEIALRVHQDDRRSVYIVQDEVVQ